MDKISGKGIYLKRGDGFHKVRQIGDGLYLKPYNATPYDIAGQTSLSGGAAPQAGDGLYFKNGGNYELIKDGTISDIPILAQLLK